MTQWAPMDPFSSDDRQGIPAADPGTGAPEQAEGYGVPHEEPDLADGDPATGDADPPADTPFSPPDPEDVGDR
jgi:hypothetical protein